MTNDFLVTHSRVGEIPTISSDSILPVEDFLLDAGPFAIGSRVRIRQPKLLPAVWTVALN
jgi:hypothetical protein